MKRGGNGRGPSTRPSLFRHTLLVAVLVASIVPLTAVRQAAASTVRFRSASTGSGAVLTMSKPHGVIPGDVLVAGIAKHEHVGRGGDITPPPGWRPVTDPAISNDLELAVYVKPVTASEPASYTWKTRDSDANGAILAYSGIDPADPVVAANDGLDRNNSSRIRVASFHIPVGGTMLVMFATIEGPRKNPITPPAGFAERTERAVHPTIQASDSVLPSPGPTGDKVARARHPASNIGAVLALRPAGSPPGG